jgi:RNA ligase
MKFDINLLEEYLEKKLLVRQKHPNLPLFIWNYSPQVQYEKLWDEVTLKCRALITDDSGLVVAKSFDKFFNLEEIESFPSESFKVYEKLDGSLILFFWHDNNFVVASRGSFSSEHSEAASKILSRYDLAELDKTKCYSGELIAKWNRIVCDYGDEEKVVLLAKFDKEGKEYSIDKYNSFEKVKTYDISNLDNIKSIIKDDQEGFVIRFDSGFRIKVKGSEYVRLHKIVTELSEKTILEGLISNNPIVLDKVPDEFYDWVKSVESSYKNKYNEILEDCLFCYREMPTRKETAGYFLKQKYPEVLFKMLDKKDYSQQIWKIIKKDK